MPRRNRSIRQKSLRRRNRSRRSKNKSIRRSMKRLNKSSRLKRKSMRHMKRLKNKSVRRMKRKSMRGGAKGDDVKYLTEVARQELRREGLGGWGDGGGITFGDFKAIMKKMNPSMKDELLTTVTLISWNNENSDEPRYFQDSPVAGVKALSNEEASEQLTVANQAEAKTEMGGDATGPMEDMEGVPPIGGAAGPMAKMGEGVPPIGGAAGPMGGGAAGPMGGGAAGPMGGGADRSMLGMVKDLLSESVPPGPMAEMGGADADNTDLPFYLRDGTVCYALKLFVIDKGLYDCVLMKEGLFFLSPHWSKKGSSLEEGLQLIREKKKPSGLFERSISFYGPHCEVTTRTRGGGTRIEQIIKVGGTKVQGTELKKLKGGKKEIKLSFDDIQQGKSVVRTKPADIHRFIGICQQLDIAVSMAEQ
jgi:hypothetical protein